MAKQPLMHIYLTLVRPVEGFGWAFLYNLSQVDKRGKGKESQYDKAKGEHTDQKTKM